MALTDRLSAIGDAIREKNGTTELIPLVDMPQAILDIAGGDGGIEYTSIIYNDDDAITLTDTDGNEHTIVCTYDGDKLVGATYDGEAVELTYEGDLLVKVGEIAIDLNNAKASGSLLDNTVTFLADGEPYEIVSVKSGNSIDAPSTNPTSESEHFQGWYNGDSKQEFPFAPSQDCDLVAVFSAVRKEMEFTTTGELIATVKKSGVDYPVTKVNDGVVVCGVGNKNNSFYIYAIAINPETADCCIMSESLNSGEITYDNKSYYYHVSRVSSATSVDYDAEKVVNVGTNSFMDETIAQAILDYYYMR